jgi:hypothetical protein
MNLVPMKKKQQRRPRQRAGQIRTVVLRDIAPDSIKVPLNYTMDIDLAGAVMLDHVINLNSLYDPDATGVGNQPLGFDQWSAFYSRYRVDEVAVQVDWINNSVNSVTDILAVASNSLTAISTAATYEAGCQSPFSKTGILAIATGNNIAQFKTRYQLHRITGVSKQKYESDDAYSGTSGSSPTEDIALHLCAKDFGFATNVATKVRVKLTFQSTFFDRVQLTIS